jgi:hypothetical protein
METKDFNALHGDELEEQHGFIIYLDPDVPQPMTDEDLPF